MNVGETIGALLIVAGAALAAIAGVGQVRFSDLFTRMHVATKPSTLGLLLVAVGTMFELHGIGAVSLLALTIVMQFLTAPVSAHLVGRAAHRHGDWEREAAAHDDLSEVDEL